MSNLNEIGVSEWEDRSQQRAIGPSTMRGQTIYHAVHRDWKHISVVACISAKGEHMMPFLVCSQGHAAMERLFKMGVDLILKSRYKPYMSSESFAEYISAVLLPYINELRSNEEFADKKTVLLMDNCSIHVQTKTLQTLADDRVKMIASPPHTTHIFQYLDLSVFGNLQKKMNDKLPL
jgi:hypothetical protein